jgi:hypothetical protein
MQGIESAVELLLVLVTHPLAWRSFSVYGAYAGLLTLALWRGGWAEQFAAGASIFQFTSPLALAFADFYWPGIDQPKAHLTSDLAFLVLFLPLIVRSQRIWPLWFYAFNLMCPLSLAVMLLTPVGTGPLYATRWIWMLCAIAALSAGVAMRVIRPEGVRRWRADPL